MAVVCWGIYGPAVHHGQEALGGNRLKPFLCVGVAYFLIAIIVPVVMLAGSGELTSGWSFSGIVWSLAAGAAGAIGAMGIIIALSVGGKPVYIMPLVFGGAPVVNAFVSIYRDKTWNEISPLFYAGLILVAVGAATVLLFAPSAKHHSAKHSATAGK